MGTANRPKPDFEDAVLAVLRGLRPGDVVSYGEVAREAGYPGAARAVGTLLRRSGADVPWWRVVRGDGTIASGHPVEQAERLRTEGVIVRNGRVRPGRASASRRGRAG